MGNKWAIEKSLLNLGRKGACCFDIAFKNGPLLIIL